MKMSYINAIHRTIEKEMKNNDKIIILGQDITMWGGAGGAFNGLSRKFGKRIFDTPISEAGTAGIGVGASMSGLRPIIEFTFFDFILCATDPIINHAAKIKHFSNGKFTVPMIIRAVISSHRGYGGTHSQNLEHIFMYPGLNVVYPSTPHDAAGLLKTALEMDDPVIFIEHKLLHKTEGDVSNEKIPFGKADIKQSGRKLTIITYGRLVPMILNLVKGHDIEVLDLRSLQPLDMISVLHSAKKTGNVLIIEDGHGFVSAKIESALRERLNNIVIRRLYAKETPIPAAKGLEDYVLITQQKIMDSIKDFQL